MIEFIPRAYTLLLKRLLRPGKVFFIVGPRRSGKTTFLKDFIKRNLSNKKVKFVAGDVLEVKRALSTPDLEKIREFVEGYDVLAIDEAQLVPNIGATLKILVDFFPKLYILATGSASLELVKSVGEPLVGRKLTLTLYPFSLYELKRYYYGNSYELAKDIEKFLLYGVYPEVFLAPTLQEKKELLYELVNSYIFRDILQLERLKYPFVLEELLKLLAYQIGNPVSYHELANELRIDVKTVEKYLWLLEKSFIIVPLRSFSRNKRNELKKSKKYYFVDLGIRNALINDFSSLDLRPDKGALWENFIFIERLKKHSIERSFVNMYFWRTKYGSEINLVEEKDGGLYAYEFKFKDKKKGIPSRFLEYYENVREKKIIHRDNFLTFVT